MTLVHIRTLRREWLAAKKLTVKEFSKAVDLDYTTVYHWFHDDRHPRGLYIERVHSVFPDFPIQKEVT
jgi:hypothetical protein